MGRMAPHRPNSKNNASTYNGVRGAKIQKQRKKHKVVLESAGNKDEDKLRVVLSFHAEPPPGYTFIPAGNTQLTMAMKDFAKRGGHQIMAVSATPHAQRHELSREVHRIGYHVPTEVVAQVCSHYGIRLDSSGRLIGEQDSEKLFMKISQKGKVVLNENIRDQVTINTEAKEIIRDLFPKIPDNDLFQIIKTAFQLGDNKVGTAEEIPLVRRAQLSVVAHIRHSYTNYDKLLRQLPYNEARHSVEKPTLKKLVEWRAGENDKTEESRKAVDDAVREVVVLSDEESSESEIEEGQVLENDDMKVEPVRALARPAVTTDHRPVSPGEHSSGEDAPHGFRYVARPSRRDDLAQVQAVSRHQESRYALWDQVRHEYQNTSYAHEAPQIIARIPLTETAPAGHKREVVYQSTTPVRYVLQDPQPTRTIRQSSPPSRFRGADGRLYERLPPQEEAMPLRRFYTPPATRTIPLQSARRSISPRAQGSSAHQRTPSMKGDGTIVPSIEPPDGAYRTLLPRPTYEIQPRATEHHDHLIDLTSSAEQATERMRISPSPPPSPYLRRTHRVDQDVDMFDEPVPPRRQLIDLSQQLPVPISSQRSDYTLRPHYEGPPRGQLYEERLPLVYNYGHPSMVTNSQHAITDHAQRHIIYEALDDRQSTARPVRYAAEPWHDHAEQRYYVTDDVVRQRAQAQVPATYVQESGPRRVVLTSNPPLDDTHHPNRSGYQTTYRTTYVQH